MHSKSFPLTLCAAADSLVAVTLSMADGFSVEEGRLYLSCLEPESCGDEPLDQAVIRTHLAASADKLPWTAYWEAGFLFSTHLTRCFGVAASARASGGESGLRGAAGIYAPSAISDPSVLPPLLHERLREWQRRWSSYDQLWRAWSRSIKHGEKVTATPRRTEVTGGECCVLTDDQQAAINQLLALARIRGEATETSLPSTLLRRWSAPLLVGPAGVGKAFLCEQVAHWSNRAFRRWDIGSWIVAASRSGSCTVDQLHQFIAQHPQGCVLYLAGVDSLATALRATGDMNATYSNTVVSELEQFLNWATSRSPGIQDPKTDNTSTPSVLVVLGGRFAALWGQAEIGGPSGADAWKMADTEPLASVRDVATWLLDHAGLPASVARKFAIEPLVLRPLTAGAADRVARRIHADLPASLDGLGVEQIAAALAGPHGWRGVAALVEQSLCAGSEFLPAGGDAEFGGADSRLPRNR